MIDTGMIKDDDMVTVVEVANGNVVRSARGRWMFDHTATLENSVEIP